MCPTVYDGAVYDGIARNTHHIQLDAMIARKLLILGKREKGIRERVIEGI